MSEEKLVAQLERIADALEQMTPDKQFQAMKERMPEIIQDVFDVAQRIKKKNGAQNVRRRAAGRRIMLRRRESRD